MHSARIVAWALCSAFLATAVTASAEGGDKPETKKTAKAEPKKKKKPAATRPAEEPAAAAEAPKEEPKPAAPEPRQLAPDPEPAKPKEEARLAAPKPSAQAGADDGVKAPSDSADHPISAAPLAGYGSDGLKLGLGVRAGYTLPSNVYVGGAFMYHFGSSSETTVAGRTYGASYSVFYPSVEGGYDVKLDRVTIRPYGGLAFLVARATTTGLGGQEVSASATSLGMYPGVSITYDIPRAPVFVGGDARVVFIFDGGHASFGAFATAGMRF